MKRIRKRDWPIRVYRYWARPLGELPPRLWWIATRMLALRNRFCDGHEQYLKDVKSLPDTPDRAAWSAAFKASVLAVRENAKDKLAACEDRATRTVIRRARDAEIKALREKAHASRPPVSGPRKERLQQWYAEAKALAKSTDLSSDLAGGLLDRFHLDCKNAYKPERLRKDGIPGFPIRKYQIENVMVNFHYGGGGEPVERFFCSRRPQHARLLLRPVPTDAYLTPDDPRRLTTGQFGLGNSSAIKFETLLHRPIPAGAIVKRVAWTGEVDSFGRWTWALNITVEEPPAKPTAQRPGKAAIHLGWRRMDDGVRIAAIEDANGKSDDLWLAMAPNSARRRPRKSIAGYPVRPVSLLPDDLAAAHPPEEGPTTTFLPDGPKAFTDLDAYIGKKIDEAKKTLQDALDGLPLAPSLTDLMAHLPKMRQGGLMRIQRELELAGVAPEAQAGLRRWRSTHERLMKISLASWEWWTRRRRWFYENEAKRLCLAYGTIVLQDDLDLKHLKESDPGSSLALQQAGKYRQWVAVGEFRAQLKQAMAKFGTRLLWAPTRSYECAECGKQTEPTNPEDRLATCPQGHRWDQDHNAARNMLRDAYHPATAQKKEETS